MKWSKELGISTLWVNFDISLDWELTGRFWGWTVATLQCLDPEACMSNPSLWVLAINLWNGARTGEENGETALDFLISCWIKKNCGRPFPSWQRPHPFTWNSRICLRVRDGPTLTHTLDRLSPLGICVLPVPGAFQATSPDYVTFFDQIQMLQNAW